MIYSLLVTTLLLSLGWINTIEAQPASLDRPAKLRITGELLPPQSQPREDLVTAHILVQDTPLLLRVGKVEEVTPMEREQAVKWGVLFRQVRFYGPDPLLQQILKAQGTGKALVIEGQLDTRDRQFLVSDVKASSDTTGQPSSEKK
jgi:hypothetical protein